jgi:very-short-patch-repair endonuclease
MSKSALEETFALHCKAYGLEPQREYKFHPMRRWKFDFCWPDRMVAVEIEGGIWNGGRHTSGAGFIKDCEKYNEAARMGYFVFRFDGGAVKRGEAIKFMLVVLGQAARAGAGDAE